METEYKGYRLISDNFNMVRVTQMGKGMVPMELRGDFTTKTFAQYAIDAYLDKKGTKDAKPSSSGSD